MIIQRVRGIWNVAIAAALLFGTARVLTASPITIIDQQNPGPFTTTNGAGVAPLSFGQSFTPTLNGIDAIQFLIQGAHATIHVDLMNGYGGADGLGGALLATSNSVFVNVSTDTMVQFDFPTTVALTPGHTYVARITMTSGNGLFMRETANLYGGGQFLNEGDPSSLFTDRDQIFAEGLYSHNPAVPEPAPIFLFALGMVGLIPVSLRNSRLRKSNEGRREAGPT